MAQKKLKTKFFPDVKPKTETFFPDVKPKTEIFFPDIEPKTEIILPDLKPETEKFFPEIKPKTEIFLSEIKPAIKPSPIDEPLPSLDDNNLLNDDIDGQTEIFFDNNYQSWIDDLPDTKPDLTFPTPTCNTGVEKKNYDAWVSNLQNIRCDLFLSDDNENLDAQTEIFVDDNYQTLVDDLPDIKPDVKTDIKKTLF